MDALEGFVWGQSFHWGYDRNPWLNAVLTSLGVQVGGQSGWLIYLFSQFSVAICFWAVWRLGKKILTPAAALLAVFLLEGIQYYTLAAVDFNDNVLELGLWALTILNFYNAVKEQKLAAWVLTGVFAGLSLMAKYYAIMLFVPMLIWLCFSRANRRSFANYGFYVGLFVFFIIVIPHFIWLFQNGFSTLNYAVMRVEPTEYLQNSALYFFVIQLANFILPFLLFAFLFYGKKTSVNVVEVSQTATAFDKQFLALLGLCPFVLTVLVALVLHMRLHLMWGTPLLSLWGLILFAFIPVRITRTKFYSLVLIIFCLFFIILGAYAYGILRHGYNSSANYPGKEVSAYVIREWYLHHKNKPEYVVGDRYTAGNLAYFSKEVLHVCIWDAKVQCQINPEELRRNGTIFVWDESSDKAFRPTFLGADFFRSLPRLSHSFLWDRNHLQSPIKLGVAFLP